MSGSSCYSIVKWLEDLPEPLRKRICIHTLHDTLEIIEYVKKVNVNDKLILAHDVESLFTNV